ncbi:hypothetical protein GF1_12320 [Desulfolithobacter dissulfuricans]|uniref:Uncharacterized protein n=1 Tax=Desulfolithobacter dissulfuricans TaxID=2795293 RepID=A0A915U9E3_9BACT|nr:hypothetical protein [Desulfolithobacter dissulfuricans]BCO08856.1 hypothetical protein GF1_12320 [Desulfolithobacter dissulfuricans]
MPFLRSLFDKWPQNILRPVAVNVLSAVVLFLLAVSLKPLVFSLFQGPQLPEYPLFCTAEPYLGSGNREMNIDFFIINRTGEPRTREQLIRDLRALNPDADRTLSPDIELELNREGEVQVLQDKDFNSGKGRLRVVRDPEGQKIKIIVDRIEPRAILKVVIRVSGVRFVSRKLNRGVKGEVGRVLRNYEQFQDSCYTEQ